MNFCKIIVTDFLWFRTIVFNFFFELAGPMLLSNLNDVFLFTSKKQEEIPEIRANYSEMNNLLAAYLQ